MQLSNFLKVPVVYFFEDFAGYSNTTSESETEIDYNYAFLAKLFSGLSAQQREKIYQVLKNTRALGKTG